VESVFLLSPHLPPVCQLTDKGFVPIDGGGSGLNQPTRIFDVHSIDPNNVNIGGFSLANMETNKSKRQLWRLKQHAGVMMGIFLNRILNIELEGTKAPEIEIGQKIHEVLEEHREVAQSMSGAGHQVIKMGS